MEKGCPLETRGTCTSLPGGCMENSRSAVHGDLDGHGRPGKEKGQAAGGLCSDTMWSHRCFSLLALGDQRRLKAETQQPLHQPWVREGPKPGLSKGPMPGMGKLFEMPCLAAIKSW